MFSIILSFVFNMSELLEVILLYQRAQITLFLSTNSLQFNYENVLKYVRG